MHLHHLKCISAFINTVGRIYTAQNRLGGIWALHELLI